MKRNNKKKSLLFLVAALTMVLIISGACRKETSLDYQAKPVEFTAVSLDDVFWAPRLEVNRTVTVPHNFKMSEETGRIKNFELAEAALAGKKDGKFLTRYPFDDSDVFKIIEAASYTLAVEPDPELEKYLDSLIDKIAAAQEPDGYLYTARTIGGPPPVDWLGKERWSYLYMSHELYNLGHLFEGAVAHYQATGKKNLLTVATKAADLVVQEFGPGKRQDPPGHQEIEIGLVKLYRVTGKKEYLDLAKFFIDVRGKGENRKLYGEYSQDHKPFLEQEEAVGHAVRAGYFYAGVADVAALTGEKAYLTPLNKIWEDVVSSKIYLTGGIGATGAWEGYGPRYHLPNATAYAETCAAIATFLWNSRMFRLEEDGKFVDVMERILYNGILSGISLSGDRFFYPNPLASFGQHERTAWFACACCPPNVARLLTSMPGYIYAVTKNKVYVNLYAQGQAKMKIDKVDLKVRQTTSYPWKGEVTLELEPRKPVEFTLMVRIPGWAVNQPVPSNLYSYMDSAPGEPSLRVNGEPVSLDISQGYVPLTRVWRAGDKVELSLPLQPRRVVAHEEVKADRGLVAIERGPLVYCAEWPDNGGRVSNLVLPDQSVLKEEYRPDLLNGVYVINSDGYALAEKSGKIVSEKKQVIFIPYYAWANRGRGEMAVWIARTPDRARVAREPGLSSKAEVKASEKAVYPARINDQYDPESSSEGIGFMHWWPKKGSLEWVEYHFKEPVVVREASVYWLDDTGTGGCRLPLAWKLFYKSGDRWLPVQNKNAFGVDKDKYNTVKFDPVKSTAFRLEVQLQPEWSAGIHEWKIK